MVSTDTGNPPASAPLGVGTGSAESMMATMLEMTARVKEQAETDRAKRDEYAEMKAAHAREADEHQRRADELERLANETHAQRAEQSAFTRRFETISKELVATREELRVTQEAVAGNLEAVAEMMETLKQANQLQALKALYDKNPTRAGEKAVNEIAMELAKRTGLTGVSLGNKNTTTTFGTGARVENVGHEIDHTKQDRSDGE